MTYELQVDSDRVGRKLLSCFAGFAVYPLTYCRLATEEGVFTPRRVAGEEAIKVGTCPVEVLLAG